MPKISEVLSTESPENKTRMVKIINKHNKKTIFLNLKMRKIITT